MCRFMVWLLMFQVCVSGVQLLVWKCWQELVLGQNSRSELSRLVSMLLIVWCSNGVLVGLLLVNRLWFCLLVRLMCRCMLVLVRLLNGLVMKQVSILCLCVMFLIRCLQWIVWFMVVRVLLWLRVIFIWFGVYFEIVVCVGRFCVLQVVQRLVRNGLICFSLCRLQIWVVCGWLLLVLWVGCGWLLVLCLWLSRQNFSLVVIIG